MKKVIMMIVLILCMGISYPANSTEPTNKTKDELMLQLRAAWGDYYLVKEQNEKTLNKLMQIVREYQKQLKALSNVKLPCPNGDCPKTEEENAD